jgi:hypothetical protein
MVNFIFGYFFQRNLAHLYEKIIKFHEIAQETSTYVISSTITVMPPAPPPPLSWRGLPKRLCDIVFVATFGKKIGGNTHTKFEVIPKHIFECCFDNMYGGHLGF